ncbi:MAG: AraC family transcriptional regulator [Burkholderiaceae bacterium]|nr:AraC family transcriptional regulator [Burkholderiaceae bacterium]
MPSPDTSAPSSAQTTSLSQERNVPPTTIGGYSLAIAKALSHSGVDAERVFKAAGVPIAIGNDPFSRLPVDALTRLYQVSVDVTHDPYFGLAVARFIHISNLHALGYAMAASGTLMDFLKRVVRYFRLVSQTAEMSLEESGDSVILRTRLLTDVCSETEDAFIGFLVLSMRQLHKSSLNPLSVALHHAMPREGAEPYEQLFRSPVSFGASQPELVLPRAELQVPLAGACPELAQYNDNIATDYLARLEKHDVIARARQKIVEFLPTGDCTRERVSEALHMSPTTLQAKLLQRETTFIAIFDETRKELACSYVQQPMRSFTEIAFLLGFSDSSNFTRAFKRWTGCSPTEYRQR